MSTTKELLKLSIISETNYRYAFSDEDETRDDAQSKIEYQLEIPSIDFQQLVDLFREIKREELDTVHYYRNKIIPFDTEAPVNAWSHFDSIEKNALRNRSIGVYEKPMYIFYVKDFSSFLLLSVRNFNSQVETRLQKIFNEII